MYKKNKNRKFKNIIFKKKINKKKINLKKNNKIKKKYKKKKIQKIKKIKNKKNIKIKYKNLKKKLIIKIKKNKKKTRPPIITIMGHVNHGKTSLVDCIRKSKKKIINNEEGNITQNINSYNIKTKLGKLTILDTPGHSTFINMRKRGINISDIIILVIAIDDGIMPQTKEIIKYSKKYNIPTIISLNKIDKTNYLNNIKNIKKKLKKYNNKYKFVKISTKNKKGINNLIKKIFKISKKLKLKTYTDIMASGIIIDSSINKNIGPTAKILIKKGILKQGDILLCDEIYGKIKSIYNDKNKIIKKAKTSMSVEISGISNIAKLGKKFITNNNIKLSKKIANLKKIINKEKKLKKKKNIYKKNIFNTKKCNKINIIIKTNSLSIIKTIKYFIKKNISKKINIIYYNIGNINKNDLITAKNTNSSIFIFNEKKKYNYNYNNIKNNYKYNNIKIYHFNLIYKLIEKFKKIYNKKFKKNIEKKIIGKSIVHNIFKISKKNIIAGCKIILGNINIKNKIKIIRKKITIYKGYIKSIKRFKNKINIANKNTECGIQIKNFNNIKIGDKIISIK